MIARRLGHRRRGGTGRNVAGRFARSLGGSRDDRPGWTVGHRCYPTLGEGAADGGWPGAGARAATGAATLRPRGATTRPWCSRTSRAVRRSTPGARLRPADGFLGYASWDPYTTLPPTPGQGRLTGSRSRGVPHG